MNRERIEQFVMRYIETTACQVIEKGEGHVTVRFSPEADKDLMNRSYYWNFVERTGAPPEPMKFTFVFDSEVYAKTNPPPGPVRVGVPIQSSSAPQGAAPAQPLGQPAVGSTTTTAPTPANGMTPNGAPNGVTPVAPGAPGSLAATAADPGSNQPAAADNNSILGRYFGFVPTVPIARIPSDVMAFGSRRLDQLFGVVQSRGRYVRLFEEPKAGEQNPFASTGYSTWFGINYKVEFICDMKRDEMFSFGIHLGTGQITERFYERLLRRPLSPKLPANIHLQPVTLDLEHAVLQLEQHLENIVKRYDRTWAHEAYSRLEEEQARIDAYYGGLLQTIEPDKKAEVEEQYKARELELDWQYRPRIQVSVINCGFFHLAEGLRTAIDFNR